MPALTYFLYNVSNIYILHSTLIFIALIRHQMNKLLSLFFFLCIVSCSNQRLKKSATTMPEAMKDSITATLAQEDSLQLQDSINLEDEYDDFYVLVADTSFRYDTLRNLMFTIHDSLKQTIDTMGRTFYPAKNLIALPEDDEDDLYAGDYYPRRYPTTDLSIEYLSFYKEEGDERNMALVTGIYSEQKSADSALTVLKKINPNAFWVKSKIYLGCIH